MQHIGERLYELRLAGAGNALDEAVAAREQAGDHFLDDRFVAYDDSRYFCANTTEFLLKSVDLHVGCGIVHCSFRFISRKYSPTASRYASGIRSALTPLSVTNRAGCDATW